MSEGPSIPLWSLLRGLAALSLAASIAVVSWAAGEVALTARRDREAPIDLGGSARAVACSQDGRTVYLATGTALIRSADGGATWTIILPQPQQSAQPPAGATPPTSAPAPTEPKNPGGTAGKQ